MGLWPAFAWAGRAHAHAGGMAVFRQNDSYGQAGLDGVNKALAAKKLQPAVVATVERNSVDVARAVREICAAKPDAVVQISAYKSCAAFIRITQPSSLLN